MADNKIKVEVTGSVWKIERQVGDAVSNGDTLMIIESMKMEIPVITEASGTIREIRVMTGDAVTEGDVVAIVAG